MDRLHMDNFLLELYQNQTTISYQIEVILYYNQAGEDMQ